MEEEPAFILPLPWAGHFLHLHYVSSLSLQHCDTEGDGTEDSLTLSRVM